MKRSFPESQQRSRKVGSLFLAFLLLAGCTRLKQCFYEGVGRDEWQKPQEVISSLDIRPGDRVADLGSGGGYFTFRLAKRAKEEGYANIEVILAKVDDLLLPASGVDLIFTSNTYHHLKDRVNYFANAKKYLRPNGRVAVIELSGKGWLESLPGHHTPKEVILNEMKAAGYALHRDFDFLPRQHFLIFSKGAAQSLLLGNKMACSTGGKLVV
jgi:arsenite methyltransferase